MFTMTQTWLLIEADFPSMKKSEISLAFVDPIITKFQNQFLNFYFSYGKHFLLRIFADEDLLNGKIEPFIRGLLVSLGAKVETIRKDPNYSEKPGFGDGSDFALRIMELASRTELMKRKAEGGSLQVGEKFDPIYFGHLFLKAWGNDSGEEAIKHFVEATWRLIFAYGCDETLAKGVASKLGKDMAPKFHDVSTMVRDRVKNEMKKHDIKVPKDLEKIEIDMAETSFSFVE
jgi:hypothetical protein